MIGSRKRVLGKGMSIVLTLALILVALSACGTKENNAVSESPSHTASQSASKQDVKDKANAEPVELRFAWWGSQGRHDRTLKVIENFQKLHPNIVIKPEYSSWGGYWEKLATQVAGNNAPDLIQMSITYIKEYSERGVLGDLTPYVGKELNTEDLNMDVLKNQGTVGGKLTGIPVSDNASGMFYNKEIYKQAGVELPKNDMTWDEFFAKAREIKDKLGGSVYGSLDMSTNLEGFMYYLFSVGDTLYNGNQLSYKDENLKNWLTMWDNARKEGLVPSANDSAAYMNGGADPNKDALMKGEVAVYGPSFTGTFPAYEAVMKDNVDMVTFPKAEFTGSALQTAMFLSTSAESKHPKEASIFLDYFLNSEEAALILETERGIPENAKVRELLSANFTERDKKMVSMLEHVASINPSWFEAGPKGAGEVTSVFTQVVQKMQFERSTVDEAVAEFRQEAEKIIAKNN